MELEEIETLLRRQHAVREAVVVVKQDSDVKDDATAQTVNERLSALDEDVAEGLLAEIEALPEEAVELLLTR